MLEVPFGKMPNGDAVTRDLVEMPHLIIGGVTGSGKSGFLHSLVCSLAQSHLSIRRLRDIPDGSLLREREMERDGISVFQRSIEPCADPAEIARKVKLAFKRIRSLLERRQASCH